MQRSIAKELNKWGFRSSELLFFFVFVIAFSCNQRDERRTLFETLNAGDTGLDFENKLTHTNDFNIYKYRNYYNGSGYHWSQQMSTPMRPYRVSKARKPRSPGAK